MTSMLLDRLDLTTSSAGAAARSPCPARSPGRSGSGTAAGTPSGRRCVAAAQALVERRVEQRLVVELAEDLVDGAAGGGRRDAGAARSGGDAQPAAALDAWSRSARSPRRRGRRRWRAPRSAARPPRRWRPERGSRASSRWRTCASDSSRRAEHLQAVEVGVVALADQPNRVISGAPPTASWPSASRLRSAVVEMPCTFSLNSSTLRRPAQRLLVRDQALLEQAEDRLVERLHAVLRRARGDRAVDQVGLLLVDDAVADEGGADHHLDRRRAALAVDAAASGAARRPP